MSLRIACTSALLLLVACGGSSSDPVIADVPDATTGLPSPSPATDGGSIVDASPTSADGGPVTTKDTRIDPIEVGHAWTYDVNVLGFYPACANGSHVSTVTSERMVEGRIARDLSSLCENAGTFTYSVDGDTVRSYLDDQWHVSLDAPITEGHTWSDDYASYRWESKGTVKTAAGTFAACWSATKVASYSSYTVFCRGVGPIHWHYEDGFGNGYDAVLTAKNF